MTTDVPQIAVDDLAERHSDGALIVDVRMPDEYAAGHVPGAVLIPLPEVPDRAGELPRDVPVYVICRSGARSQRASEYLRPLGIDAHNVSGGTLAWIEAGLVVDGEGAGS